MKMLKFWLCLLLQTPSLQEVKLGTNYFYTKLKMLQLTYLYKQVEAEHKTYICLTCFPFQICCEIPVAAPTLKDWTSAVNFGVVTMAPVFPQLLETWQ